MKPYKFVGIAIIVCCFALLTFLIPNSPASAQMLPRSGPEVIPDDIQNDPRLGYRRICDFLGIQPQRVSVSYVRTSPFPINALLRNHHMVAKALRDTPYEWMLHD